MKGLVGGKHEVAKRGRGGIGHVHDPDNGGLRHYLSNTARISARHSLAANARNSRIDRKRVEKELAEFVVGERFERNAAQAADQFERLTGCPDEVAGGIGWSV
jgi:hypothetical protein